MARCSRRKALVAPHAGAWIETGVMISAHSDLIVAPHAGAWIETIIRRDNKNFTGVAPHAGAWIETSRDGGLGTTPPCRPPRGGVD